MFFIGWFYGSESIQINTIVQLIVVQQLIL